MLSRTGSVASSLAIAICLLPIAAPGPASAATGGSDAAASWPWPLAGDVVTPYRNGTDPYAAGQHRGVDIAAPAGTPARAVVAGRVSFSGRLPDGGETVTLRTSSHLVSYLHLASRAVRRGEELAAGVVIGAVGTTGKRSAEQSHLHFSVRDAETRAYLDPLRFLGPPRVVEPPAVPTSPLEAAPQAVAPAASRPRVRVSPIERAGVRPRAIRGEPSAERVRRAVSRRSLKAPPPLREPRATPRHLTANTPAERTAPSEPIRATNEHGARIPWRLVLLASAASCAIVLWLSRRPPFSETEAGPAAPAAEAASTDSATVVQLRA